MTIRSRKPSVTRHAGQRKEKVKVRVCDTPRISATKLVEFVDASSARKATILHDQKYQRPLKAVQYGPARQAIRDAMVTRVGSVRRLKQAMYNLKRRRTSSQFLRNSYRSSALALRTLARILNEVVDNGVEISSRGLRYISITLEGTHVSIGPLLATRRASSGGVGAILLVFDRSKQLTTSGGKDLAVLIAEGLRHWGVQDVDPLLCLAIDVFRRSNHGATRDTSQTMDRMRAACKDVAFSWLSISYRGDPSDLVPAANKAKTRQRQLELPLIHRDTQITSVELR